MNLLEHYIVEIHRVWENPMFSNFVNVDLTYVCYGQTKRNVKLFHKDEWARIREEGVFLA